MLPSGVMSVTQSFADSTQGVLRTANLFKWGITPVMLAAGVPLWYVVQQAIDYGDSDRDDDQKNPPPPTPPSPIKIPAATFACVCETDPWDW